MVDMNQEFQQKNKSGGGGGPAEEMGGGVREKMQKSRWGPAKGDQVDVNQEFKLL